MSLRQRAEELGLRYLLFSFSDLFGTPRSKLVPVAAADEVAANGAAFAGFATWLDMTPADPDVFAVPDVTGLIPLPWKPEVGWVPCDLWMNGRPVAHGPRNVLKASLARAAERGFTFRTGVECEFFLISPDARGPSDPLDRQIKPCYDQQALVRRFDVIAEIVDAIAALGWEPYQIDHEDANGQFEINWKYADALVTADRQTFFKYLVKSLAEKHGMRATFMPKPFSHLTGNGCHMHVSLWNRGGSENLFQRESDEMGLSPTAYAFLGGVLHSAPALAAFTNPTINSYRRIHCAGTSSGATWSPNTVSFTGNNRTHMIRIPGPGRFELRLGDGAMNPYLAPAAVLEAGLDGITHRRDPGPRRDVNAYQDRSGTDELTKLPDNLLDALRALEADTVLAAGLGPELVRAYLKLQYAQWRDYSSHVSQWESERTLDC